MKSDFDSLVAAGCEVLSPRDVEFIADVDGFVFAEHELGEDPLVVERHHLAALETADFVWLHAPGGYVGPSAAMELGVAHALGTTVVSREVPSDVMLRYFATPVGSVMDALQLTHASVPHAPTRPLDILQAYYARVADQRGYSEESPQDAMLLLTEEVGELARAVRKRAGLARAGGYAAVDAAQELADVQLYILHLANVLRVDLAAAVADKERLNAQRASAAALAA